MFAIALLFGTKVGKRQGLKGGAEHLNNSLIRTGFGYTVVMYDTTCQFFSCPVTFSSLSSVHIIPTFI
ncbi:MAG TPA: hypothetical protein VFM90_08820, partial [Cyclobacteriaceae bacterium]|nr:hypothetical protein [Cyclobacteriaceae bacterium]